MENKSVEHKGKEVATNDAKGDARSKPLGKGHKDEGQGQRGKVRRRQGAMGERGKWKRRRRRRRRGPGKCP